MFYIDKIYSNTLEVKQSKFIAHLTPYNLYEETLQNLKQLHPKARHFVTAFRYLNEFGQIVEASSDDGEPKGTSGKPTLMVLQGANLIECGVITVRYFGGTKLGTGGLVRAYSDALNLVIKDAKLLPYKKHTTCNISFDYTNQRKVEYECQNHNIEILQRDFKDKAIYTIKAPKEDMDIFLSNVSFVNVS